MRSSISFLPLLVAHLFLLLGRGVVAFVPVTQSSKWRTTATPTAANNLAFVKSSSYPLHQRHQQRCCATNSQRIRIAQNQVLAIPRGGSSSGTGSWMSAVVAWFPLSVQQTAIIATAFLALNGLSVVLVPGVVLKDLDPPIDNNADPTNLSFSTYLLRGMGCLSIGTAIHVAATILWAPASGAASITQAMGFSMLPRFLFLVACFVTRVHGRVGIQNTRVLKINTIAMAWTLLSLLKGSGRPLVSARIFSTLALLKAAFLVVNPVGAAQKIFGIDVTNNDMKRARALCRGLGNELLTSAALMFLMAVGVAPAKAAGYTALLWIGLLVDMAFVDKTWKLMDAAGPVTQMIHIGVSTVLALGFLKGQ